MRRSLAACRSPSARVIRRGQGICASVSCRGEGREGGREGGRAVGRRRQELAAAVLPVAFTMSASSPLPFPLPRSYVATGMFGASISFPLPPPMPPAATL